MRWATGIALSRTGALLLGLAVLGCNNRGAQPGLNQASKPAADMGKSTTQPAPSAATGPATQPESQPATEPQVQGPLSTFDTKPPYRVQLYVRKAEDEQPGWLKVLSLADENALATATGVFPEHNRIEVETENIRRLQLELGYLPLSPNRRVVLHIDKQGIEITQRDRKIVILERKPTGAWVVERPPKE